MEQMTGLESATFGKLSKDSQGKSQTLINRQYTPMYLPRFVTFVSVLATNVNRLTERPPLPPWIGMHFVVKIDFPPNLHLLKSSRTVPKSKMRARMLPAK